MQSGNTDEKKKGLFVALSNILSVYSVKCFSYVVCVENPEALFSLIQKLFKLHLNVNLVAIRKVRQSIISRIKSSIGLYVRPVWVEPSQCKG